MNNCQPGFGKAVMKYTIFIFAVVSIVIIGGVVLGFWIASKS